MKPLRFCFVLHVHQPVGNFDHVFRQHADEVYTPFLDFLEEHALWPVGLHVSGPLIEWLGENDVALHDRIGRLVADGSVELLAAGWYEPVLAALSAVDRAEQLQWTQAELERRFGRPATGVWLTERVWEPDLPVALAEAGLEYVLLDDHLALRAGVPHEHLTSALRCEAQGRVVDVLTIDERLRYLIPFRPVEELEQDLRRRRADGAELALIGDDGEKFGGWPGTAAWLYEGGWLERFAETMTRLREEEVIEWVTPADAHRSVPSHGPVYLPSGSYPEMEGWALGGHWKGFLTRYPEANRMHKRMSALSTWCRDLGDPPAVRRAIGRAQCNDAYWHGVFGGLYMKHLREGVRRQLLAAERALRAGQELRCEQIDVDGDGRDEWWVSAAGVSAWIEEDGTISDLMLLEAEEDLVDVLTRYREEYHEEAVDRFLASGGSSGEASRDPAGDGANRSSSGDATARPDDVPSIHDTEENAVLERLPPRDLDTRVLVRERVLTPGLDESAYVLAEYDPLWSGRGYRLVDGPTVDVAEGGGGASRVRWRWVAEVGDADGAHVEKTLTIREDGTVTYEWSWDPDGWDGQGWFAPEVSLSVDAPLRVEPDAHHWSYPIVTTSKCPEGFEEIEQGRSTTPLWPVSAGRGRVDIG